MVIEHDGESVCAAEILDTAKHITVCLITVCLITVIHIGHVRNISDMKGISFELNMKGISFELNMKGISFELDMKGINESLHLDPGEPVSA